MSFFLNRMGNIFCIACQNSAQAYRERCMYDSSNNSRYYCSSSGNIHGSRFIERIASSNQQIKTIAKRIEVATAFAEDDYNKMKEKLAEGKATVMNNVSKAKGRLTFERNMDERKGVKLATLQKMSETIVESLKNKLMDEKYANQLLETLENEKVNLKTDNKKSYKSVFRMVKRNPGAIRLNWMRLRSS